MWVLDTKNHTARARQRQPHSCIPENVIAQTLPKSRQATIHRHCLYESRKKNEISKPPLFSLLSQNPWAYGCKAAQKSSLIRLSGSSCRMPFSVAIFCRRASVCSFTFFSHFERWLPEARALMKPLGHAIVRCETP